MADPKQVKVFDGTNWVGIKPDDPNLPISSTDDKVTLSDDGSGQFQIETGIDEASKTARVYVEADGKFGVGKVPTTRFMVGDIDDSEFFYGSGFAYVRHTDDKQSGLFLINNNAEGNANRGIWGLALENGSKNDNSLYIYNSGVSGVGTDPRFEFTAGSTNNFIIKQGQLQTDTITAKAGAANECSLTLDTNLNILCGIAGNPSPAVKRAQFRAAIDNGGVLVIGTPAAGTTPSIPGISIHNDQNTVTSQQQIRLVGAGGTADYSYVGKTADAFNVVDNELISGGVFYVGTDHGDAIFFSKDSELVFATGGLQASKERLRITDDDIKAQTGYEPQTDSSLVTKGWVTTNTATGSYLPLAGGTFDPGVDVVMPSGASVQPNFQVGGVSGETPRPSFTIAGKSSIEPNPNVQLVAWCAAEKDSHYTGSAYVKFAHGQEDTDDNDEPDAPMSYFNMMAAAPQRRTVPELILNDAYNPDEAESNPDYNVPEYIESGVQLYDRTDYHLQVGGVVKPYDSSDGNGTGNQAFIQYVMSTSVNERRTECHVPLKIVDTKGLYARNLQTLEGVDTDTRVNLYQDSIRVMPQQAYPGYSLPSNNDYALDVRMPNAKMRIRNDYVNLDTGDGPNDGSTSFRLDTGSNTGTTRIELCSGNSLRGELRNEGTSGLFLQSQYATSFVSGNKQAGYHNAGHWYMGDGPNPSKLSGYQSSAVTVKVECDQNRGGSGGYTGVQSAPSMPPAASGNLMSFGAASYYVNDDTTNVFSYNADRPVGNLDNVRVDNQSQITVNTYAAFRVGNPVKSKARQNIGFYAGIYDQSLPSRGFFGQYGTVQIPNPDYIDESTTPGVPPTVDQVNEILPPDPDYPADIQVNFKEGIPSPDDLPPLQYGSDMTAGHPVNGDAYVIAEGDYTGRCYCLTGWDANVEDSGEWLIGKVEGFEYTNYAIYCDGSSPSRFNGDIKLSYSAAITGTVDTDTRLYIASGYLNLQIEKGSTGSVLAIRRLQGETTANAWTKYVSKADDGTIENGWFGYEFDAKRYRFLESGGGYSAFAFDVNNENQIAMRVPNGDTTNPPMLHVQAGTNTTPKYSRSFKDIANASMPDGWSPSSSNQLATKEYTDSRIWKGTQSEYNALSSYDDEILYCITG